MKIARRLSAETAMTLNRLAQRLGMGAKTHLAYLLDWSERTGQAERG